MPAVETEMGLNRSEAATGVFDMSVRSKRKNETRVKLVAVVMSLHTRFVEVPKSVAADAPSLT
jgi:hypothetical protein